MAMSLGGYVAMLQNSNISKFQNSKDQNSKISKRSGAQSSIFKAPSTSKLPNTIFRMSLYDLGLIDKKGFMGHAQITQSQHFQEGHELIENHINTRVEISINNFKPLINRKV